MEKIRYGMVGGGPGAFIGDVHRKAITMDGLAELVAGSFSRNGEKNASMASALNLDPTRVYKDYIEMAEKESERPDGIQLVVCVTPNVSHFDICKTFLEKGINVVCDKPVTCTVEEAEELLALKNKKGLLFGVTYTYTGYPAVKEMRELVKAGKIGKIRYVAGEYPQDWLGGNVDEKSNLAPWRMNPDISGVTNCLGDIGTHIEALVACVTGLKIKSVCARMDRLVEGRSLDDNDTVLIEYEGGAKGCYWSSQIAWGYDNAVRIRIFGEKGGLEWVQEDPDHFILTPSNGPKEIWSRGREAFAPAAQRFSRIPSGHQEGLIEAFANIYKAYLEALMKKLRGEELTDADWDYPTLEMGVDGVRFIHKCVESSSKGAVWVNY